MERAGRRTFASELDALLDDAERFPAASLPAQVAYLSRRAGLQQRLADLLGGDGAEGCARRAVERARRTVAYQERWGGPDGQQRR